MKKEHTEEECSLFETESITEIEEKVLRFTYFPLIRFYFSRLKIENQYPGQSYWALAGLPG